MFGKAYLSMYEGSMIGAGPVRFAVWNYVIAKAYKSRVEVNPKLLGPILGCSHEEVIEAIGWLCQPDMESRNKEFDGARMVKEGQFQYFVPSWDYYHRMRDEDDRREYNRRKQAESRARKSTKPASNGEPLPPISQSQIPEAKKFERIGDQDEAPAVAYLPLPKVEPETLNPVGNYGIVIKGITP